MVLKTQYGKISASMMCSDLLHIKENVATLEKAKVEYLHIDVMDGEVVPNLGLGMDYLNRLRELTCIPMDIHFMVNKPEEKLSWLRLGPRDQISIHYESTMYVQRTIERARQYGCRVMLAINPATPVCMVEEMLEYIDGVTVLTVNPGFAGQKIVHSCIKKTGKLRAFLNGLGFENLDIEVDGNISIENARILHSLGANIFVAGTSSIFPRHGVVAEERISQLRSAIM